MHYTHQKEPKCKAAVYEHCPKTQSLENNANQNAHIDDRKFVPGK